MDISSIGVTKKYVYALTLYNKHTLSLQISFTFASLSESEQYQCMSSLKSVAHKSIPSD